MTIWPPAINRMLLIAPLLCCFGCQPTADTLKHVTWRDRLKQDLPALGHRNWIVIADAAYPKQSAPGIETVVTGAGQIEVLTEVLQAIEQAPHVQAVVMLDKELEQVTEDAAPGVEAYRNSLGTLLKEGQMRVLPHEEMIRELDEGSKLFNVLLLKTDMTIPYTSVFLQLDCGYWDAEREAGLRESISTP